ncbi:unnamed protein product, partial [marine sediment metagenome]
MSAPFMESFDGGDWDKNLGAHALGSGTYVDT